jgi:hypothetical protein
MSRPAPAGILAQPNTPLERRPRNLDSGPTVAYDDTYDELVGPRTPGDGSIASYVLRDGDPAVHAILFSHGRHNGLYLGIEHGFITTWDRNLVEVRQARALSGLCTQDSDVEIEYRVRHSPDD